MRVVFTAAIMDLCHEGHLNLLAKMRVAGDRTIVVLHDDASAYWIKGKIPIQDLAHRKNNLLITGLVDEIWTTTNSDPGSEFEKIIRRNRDYELLFMRGDDNPDFPGRKVIDRHKIRIELVPYTPSVSSTSLRDLLRQL